jgi:uncharacterized protein DUF4340
MSRQRFIALLAAALVAICGALYLSTQRYLPRDPHGMALLPSLAAELNTVTSLSVRKGGAAPTVTLHKQGEQWTVAERGEYPADVPKLRKLLLALSDAKIREEKTSNPENYSIIGVEDPAKEGATGAQIELTAQDGKHDVIVGKNAGEGNFVRRAGEKTSYIVEPGISFEAEPRYWIDTHLLDVATDKIQSIETKPATGAAYALRRVTAVEPKPADAKTAGPSAPAASATGTPPASKFVLEGAPTGRQPADPRTLAPSPTLLGGLTAEDVAPAGDIDFSKPSVVTVTLADGSVLTLTGAVAGDKRWIQVAAPKDASLNAKTQARAFEIAPYRYDAIFRPLEQLLVPKPAVPDAKKPVPSTAKKPPPAPKP